MTKKIHLRGSWTGTPWAGVGRVWFGFRSYYPFGKGPGQHIIRCLVNKKCENERTNARDSARWFPKNLIFASFHIFQKTFFKKIHKECAGHPRVRLRRIDYNWYCSSTQFFLDFLRGVIFARTWFVPLSVCDHSQVVYFPPTTGGGVSFFGFYSNKETKQTDKWPSATGVVIYRVFITHLQQEVWYSPPKKERNKQPLQMALHRGCWFWNSFKIQFKCLNGLRILGGKNRFYLPPNTEGGV